MRNHFFSLTSATLLMALGSAAQAVVIDNFGPTNGGGSCIGGATFNQPVDTGGVIIGGDRDIACTRTAGTGASDVNTLQADTDFYVLSVDNNPSGTKTDVTVVWDGVSAVGLNANLIANGEDTFSMIVAALDLANGFSFIVTIEGNNTQSMSYGANAGDAVTFPDFRRIKVSLSAFTGYDTAILTDVKKITLALKTERDESDFGVGTLETMVPEPGTLALFGLGAGALGGMVRRRRRAL